MSLRRETERSALEKHADQMGIREMARLITHQQRERDDLLRRLTEALREWTVCLRQREAMREVLTLMDVQGARQGIQAPEDAAVRALCERVGYGAVMDSAARQWRANDPQGAFLVGPCVCQVEQVLATPKQDAESDE